MKRVLFITYTHSNGGGAEALLTSYVNRLDKEKYQVTVQEVCHYNVRHEALDRNIILRSFPFMYGNNLHLFRLLNQVNIHLLKTRPEILQTIFLLESYDCVVTWNYQLPSFMLSAFNGCRRIAWFHGSIDDLALTAENRLQNSELEFCNRRQREVWAYADCIVTISNKSRRSIEQVFPELARKCVIIPNGVDSEYVSRQARLPCPVALNPGKRHLVCCGRLDKNKNFALAIEALAIIQGQQSNVDLVLIGAGACRQELEDLAAQLNVKDDVVFTGYQNNPFAIIGQCDIFCLTSFSEGCPMVILEAMILGKPFVTTPVSGASEELCRDGTCGLVAGWNPADFAEKVVKILSDPQLYRSMSQTARLHGNMFTVDKSVEELEKLLDVDCRGERDGSVSGSASWPCIVRYICIGLFYFDFHAFVRAICSCFRRKGSLKSAGRQLFQLLVYAVSIAALPLKLVLLLSYLFLVKGQAHEKNH